MALKELTILHSNDMHGDFLTEDKDRKLVGGVSMLSGYISKVREENPNTIYCIAGDMFRGSVIDSEYMGLSTIEIMNMLAPDVVTLGNHETDYGLSHLLFIEKCANFPIINANLHIKTNGRRLFDPYKIIDIDGMKILFIGILTEEVIAQTKTEKLIGSIVDIEDAAKEVGKICDAYHAIDIDFTVLLTHIGFEEDKKLAALLDPAWGVDVIVGGHSHTFIEQPEKVNDVLIVQAGTGTDQIGRFDLTIDTDTNSVASYKWQAVPIDNRHCPKDPMLESLLGGYREKVDRKYNAVVTRLAKKLTHPRRTQETSLGNLFADAMKESLNLDIFMMGSGSIRKTEMEPIVTLKELNEVFPYDDPVYMFGATGAQFKQMIKYMVRDEVWEGVHCEFYQLSDGLEITYDRATHEFLKFDFEGEPIRDDKVYRIGMQSWHYLNFEDVFNMPFSEFEGNLKPKIICTSCRAVIEEYLKANQNINSDVYGRLVIL